MMQTTSLAVLFEHAGGHSHFNYLFLRWIPLGASLIVAVQASALKTFKFQEQWVNYRTTCEMLRKEIHLYDAGVDEYSDVEDKEALFVEPAERLISRENTFWLVTVKQKKEEEQP